MIIRTKSKFCFTFQEIMSHIMLWSCNIIGKTICRNRSAKLEPALKIIYIAGRRTIENP